MEPRKEDKVPEPRVEQKSVEKKPKRFRLVRLEERIAPKTTHFTKKCSF